MTIPDTARESHRLAIVLSHPIQYYSPWFQWLAARTTVRFRVFYLWDFGAAARRDPRFGKQIRWDVDLLSGYEHEFVPNVASDPGTHHFAGLDNPELPARLAAWRPTAVLLFGYAWKSHLRTLWWARRHRVPVVLRGDSHLLGRETPAAPRRLAMRFLLQQFRAFLAVGEANRDFYRTYGVPEERIFRAPHAVSAERFNPNDAGAKEVASRLREELGIAGRRIVLFAGKFVSSKQPVELLEAFHAVAGTSDALVLAGDGALRGELEARTRARPDRVVRLLPFANQSEMPARYLLADIFALPSRGHHETWGLAVNEAMHLNIPCLVSDRVGCQRDLVTPGETGWVFKAEAPGALEKALKEALQTPPGTLERMRANVRQRIAGYTYAETTDGLLAALACLRGEGN
jgi:glycosyltransferase involved in cell wall biosynthesis